MKNVMIVIDERTYLESNDFGTMYINQLEGEDGLEVIRIENPMDLARAIGQFLATVKHPQPPPVYMKDVPAPGEPILVSSTVGAMREILQKPSPGQSTTPR